MKYASKIAAISLAAVAAGTFATNAFAATPSGEKFEGTITYLVGNTSGNSTFILKENDGDTYNVLFATDAKIVRKYNGKASASELKDGDMVVIHGTKSSDGTITATHIKDQSIFIKGVAKFAATVTSVNTSTNTIGVTVKDKNSTSYNGSFTYTDQTKITSKTDGKKTDLTENDIEVGDTIHVNATARVQGTDVSLYNVTHIMIK